MNKNYKILVVDDDKELCSSVKTALSTNNYLLSEAFDGEEALLKIQTEKFNLVLLDVDMPKLNGLGALKKIKEYDPSIIVIMITAYTNLKDAVQAVRDGAYNYISKPIKHAEIVAIVERAIKAHELIETIVNSAPVLDVGKKKQFIGVSGEMQKIFDTINKLTKYDTTVLIRGESGTGKELVARAIHFNSTRKDKEFVVVNCSALPENLIESELFGHEKGAFTGADQRKIGKFQYADGGSIFLDEIGDIPTSMQVKLLRAIQEKTFYPVGSNREIGVDVRIIAATNRDLEQMIKESKFREDLFYRLNILPIFLPPLRERRDDVEHLVKYFVNKFNERYCKTIKGPTKDCLNLLRRYNWPGNIRELENVIERSFIVENTGEITPSSLPERICGIIPLEQQGEAPSALDFNAMKEKFEKDFLVEALKTFKGKINQTAIHANIPKKTLLRKLEKYQITAKDYK